MDERLAIAIVVLNIFPAVGFGLLVNYLYPWFNNSYYFLYLITIFVFYFSINCLAIISYKKIKK